MHKTQTLSFETKEEGRRYARNLRQSWRGEQLAAWSAEMAGRLIASPLWEDAATLLSFVGALPGEIETRPLLIQASEQGKRVLVPVTRTKGLLEWSELEDLENLEQTHLGLYEPRADKQVLTHDTAGLCLVPGMLFRRDGHRIGFGGGYYDRFLRDHKGPTVGLCPSACFAHDFPVAPHDVPVAWIVTEREIASAHRQT